MAEAEWKPYETGEKMITKIMMNGMTDKNVEDLVPLAKSWLNAPELKLNSSGFKSNGYDPTQMAYLLEADGEGGKLELKLNASEESPVSNPAFVVANWGPMNAEVKLDGKVLECGAEYRTGLNSTVDSVDLIVWLKTESTEPVDISISAAE
jgi:hypothetical protein